MREKRRRDAGATLSCEARMTPQRMPGLKPIPELRLFRSASDALLSRTKVRGSHRKPARANSRRQERPSALLRTSLCHTTKSKEIKRWRDGPSRMAGRRRRGRACENVKNAAAGDGIGEMLRFAQHDSRFTDTARKVSGGGARRRRSGRGLGREQGRFRDRECPGRRRTAQR